MKVTIIIRLDHLVYFTHILATKTYNCDGTAPNLAKGRSPLTKLLRSAERIGRATNSSVKGDIIYQRSSSNTIQN